MISLTLNRQTATDTSIIGHLFNGGELFAYSLENKEKAILSGVYEVKMQYSPRFERNIPHLQNVPHRTAIEIHPGNTFNDSQGCILVGYKLNDDNTISESRDASDDLNKILQAEQDAGGRITITINDIVPV